MGNCKHLQSEAKQIQQKIAVPEDLILKGDENRSVDNIESLYVCVLESIIYKLSSWCIILWRIFNSTSQAIFPRFFESRFANIIKVTFPVCSEKILVKNVLNLPWFFKKNIWNLMFMLNQTVLAVHCVCVSTRYTFWWAWKIMQHKIISLPVSDCMFFPQHHEYLMSDSHESIRWCAKYTLKNFNSIRLELCLINNCSCHYEESNVS